MVPFEKQQIAFLFRNRLYRQRLSTDVISKVDKIKDCRCIVCKKIGFQAQKQLERKAISVFDIEGSIDEILGKIIEYYRKLDQRRLKRNKEE